MNWSLAKKNMLGANLSTFGEDATFIPEEGDSYTVRVIFDDKFVELTPEGDSRIHSNQCRAGVRLSDFTSSPTLNDRIEIRGVTYVLVDIQEDGQGGATIRLHEE